MNCNLTLLILTIVTKIWAAKFTVVSFNGPCKLNIGGALYRMESNSTVPNLYKAYVTAKPGTKYIFKYI